MNLVLIALITLTTFFILTCTSPTIKVTSPLLEFRHDARFNQIFKQTYSQITFTNYSQIQSLLRLAIQSQQNNSMRNIILYIQGKFQKQKVTVSHNLILYYETVLRSWYQSKGSHQFRLQLWLRGEGSFSWIEDCKEKLDFDELEIVAVDGTHCRLFGGRKYNLNYCNVSNVNYYRRVIDGANIIQYTLNEQKVRLRSIMNINFALKLYFNHTAGTVVAFGKDYFQYGTIIEYNQTVPFLRFRREGREITVNSTTLVSEYTQRPLAEVYNCVNRSIYYGGWKNGSFHGMGYQIAERTQYKYMGMYQNGNKHGKGIVVVCNKNLSALCDQVLSTRKLNTAEDLYSGNIFIGDFQNNWRKSGIHRKSHQLQLGRYGYYYNTTNSDRLYLTMKLSGFSIRYSLQVYHGYAERRLLGLFIDGALKKGYVQTCYLRSVGNESVLVPEYNSTGIFNVHNEVDRGVRQDQEIVAFGDFFVNPKKMILMTRKTKMSNQISELYYGTVNQFNKKHGKAISYTENYSYFGEYEDDFINGYGNKTVYKTNTSYEGYFSYDRFMEGVSIEKVGNQLKISEGYFINNKPTSNSITYTTGSHLLIKGNNESYHVISTTDQYVSELNKNATTKGKSSKTPIPKIIPSSDGSHYAIIHEL